MDPVLERVEDLGAVVVEDDELSVEHVVAGREVELREVAAERLAAARLDEEPSSSRKTSARKPSYFGSYAQPSPLGSFFAERASCG